MRADFFIHPDFLNRTRKTSVEAIGSDAYTGYFEEIQNLMRCADIGVLAYSPINFSSSKPDSAVDIMDLFRRPGRFCYPTIRGNGLPRNDKAGSRALRFLGRQGIDDIVAHGSYANDCVKQSALWLSRETEAKIRLGTVLSRSWQYSGPVWPGDFAWPPELAQFVDEEETRVHAIGFEV